MKIIHLFRTGGAGYGLERNLLCTLPGLARRGVETVAMPVTEARCGPASEAFLKELDKAGVRVVPLEVGGRLPFRLARRLSDVLRSEAPQIVHSHDYKCDLTMLLARTAGMVRMATIHGWCSRSPKERFFEWLDVQCCKRMDAVVVFCEDYRRRLTSRGVPDPLVRIVPVGMDLAHVPASGTDFRRVWDVADGALLVGQVGRLSREKQPDVFVRVAAELAKTSPGARFVLVGGGPMEAELKTLAQALGLGNTLIFAGYVEAMSDVLDAIGVAVNCSSTEAMPRTLFEAALKEIPVVATAVGGVPEIIEDGVTGILCPPGDTEAIRVGIARLLADADLRTRMGTAARRRVQTVFGIDTCTQKLIELYENLLRV